MAFWVGAVKGTAFVLASAAALFWLVRREVRALTHALGLLRAVVDGTTDAVFVKDRDGKYLMVNEAAARFVGRPVADVLGRSDADLFDPAGARARARVRPAGDGIGPNGDHGGRADRRRHPALIWPPARPARDAGGAVTGVVGIARDITDRKRAESERAAHLRYFESMDRVNRALYVSNDLERTMGAVLDVVLAEFGCDRALLVYPCDPAAPTWTAPIERTRPEYPAPGARGLEVPVTPEIVRTFTTVLGARGPVRFGPGGDHPLPATAAERFGVRSQLAMAVYPLMGAPWMFGLHQCTHARVWEPGEERLFREIGRRLADTLTSLIAFRDLRTSEERYRALVELSPDAIVVVRGGRIAFANAAAARMVRGADPAALIGLIVNDHIHPDDLPVSRARQETVLREGRTVPPHEFRMRALDGAYIDAEVCGGPCVVDGAPGIQFFARDVTERRRAAALLAHQNRVLERIATGAPLAGTLDEIVRFVEAEFPGLVCSILLLDRGGRHLRIGAAPNLPQEYNAVVDGFVIGPCGGSCGTAAYTREPVHVADIATDPLWAEYKQHALVHGLRACWSTPIFGAARGAAPRAVLGTFAVYARAPGAPDPRLAPLIGRAEHLASVAIEREHADRDLRESEERFRAAMVGSLDAVYFLTAVRDPGGRITDFVFSDVNPKGEALIGFPRAALIGKPLCEVRPETRTDGFFDKYVRVVETRTPLEEEFSSAAGFVGWLHHQVVPLGDGVVITSCDVTERKRAEAALRASQRQFAQLVANVEGIVWEADAGTFRFTFVSERAERLLGYPTAQWTTEPRFWVDHIHPDDRDWVVDFCLGATAERRNHDFEYRFIAADGRTVWLRDIVSVIADGDRATKLHGLMVDVTAQKRAEQALRDSEERFRTFVDHATDAFFLQGPDQRVLDVNRQACVSLGCEREELIGQTPADFDPDVTAALVEQQRTRLGVGETITFDARHRRKDGTTFPVEVRLRPFETQGKRFYLALARDVTERKRAEAELRESEERLRLFIDHVAAPIAMFDRDLRYVHVSRRWRTDYRLGDRALAGLSHYEVFPELPERWKETYRRCLAGAVERCEEDRFERADGTVQWLRWEIRPWHRADGAVGGVVMFAEDITARKRMEAQLHQAQKMEAVGRLAGGIAHDFNNLLTVINGFCDLTLREMAGDDPHRGALTEVRSAGERAARLTQQLLAYSRKAMIEPKVIDLNVLVSESVELLRRLIGEDIVVASDLQPAPARIRADRGQIEQVVMNLVVNARDAMPTGGRVTVETRTVTIGPDHLPDDPDLNPGRYVRLTVADTGAGMPEEVLAHVFEPFFTTKGVGKGTGLGLAVVQGAVKQSGGHIGVSSAVGVGTTFTLLFPAVADPAASVRAGPERSVRGAETILLAEDEGAVRTIARLALESYGYTVLAVGGGADALATAAAHAGEIALLVTDVVMPGMNGRQLAEELRRRQPGLRVLFMSGYTDDVVVRHGLVTPVDAFIQKPFSPEAMARKVREMLDRQREPVAADGN
ncbi:PAS domain S-box protein [Frigoriglobus tundricola]|uniref:histidine kinase n=1 Tax=Frigoriglobus tundricola TaxID=2774151 RepID=A0A6M5Z128_9BACT|nr:PAS domain S-box protein [Frigoriglobus tundricola]QJX00098.1 hypothetical protein FTUN_7722 [Frigoriglobus tundricola]